tara:strand:- start:801 stop:1469 length:669 start_codon:yes stop_codon:yes gene_type:complete
MNTSEIIILIVNILYIVSIIIYTKRSAKVLNTSFGILLLLGLIIPFVGVLTIWILRKIKQRKESRKLRNTEEVIQKIKTGKLPERTLIQNSNFNATNQLWEKYLILFEKQEEKNAKRAEKERLSQVEAERKFDAKIDRLKQKWGEGKVNRALREELFVDMDLELLKIAKGSPDLVDERVVNYKHKYKYFYGKYTNQRGNPTYDFQVDVEEGKVIGWRNLKIN